MKNCRKCGQEIDDNAIFCHKCGERVNGDNPNNMFGFNPYNGGFAIDNRGSRWVAVLSFLFYQVGIILWLVWRNTRPGKARSAIKGTVAGACYQYPVLGLVLWFLLRDDFENRDLAKIGGISAIVGACVAALSSVILMILTSFGFFNPDVFFEEFFAGVNAAFTYFSFLG